MPKTTSDKECRLCRRAGTKLFLKGERCLSAKCSFTRRSYKPGAHGQRRAPKTSEFNRQLQEKQKVRWIYNLSERQLNNYFDKASKSPQSTGEKMLQILESRLDNVVYRSGFAASRLQARQIISHHQVKVNNRVTSIPSFQLKPKDQITIRAKNLTKGSAEPVPWIKPHANQPVAVFLRNPERSEIPHDVDEQLIIEYYSR